MLERLVALFCVAAAPILCALGKVDMAMVLIGQGVIWALLSLKERS